MFGNNFMRVILFTIIAIVDINKITANAMFLLILSVQAILYYRFVWKYFRFQYIPHMRNSFDKTEMNK